VHVFALLGCYAARFIIGYQCFITSDWVCIPRESSPKNYCLTLEDGTLRISWNLSNE